MSTEPSVDIDNLPKGQEFHASKPGSEPMMTGGVCLSLSLYFPSFPLIIPYIPQKKEVFLHLQSPLQLSFKSDT